ncbi:DUF2061 domain-containing protein [Bernardetia sp.]|uniref:DUF2061 domain-containing protein n=1 Tax=Bernardetia sp. TaxID=1937974 RepID=UPI0025C5544B|nr:DUF2061 domain-containing protein [Bernardetia sp.]
MKETIYRSIVKGISWRVFATVDTILLSWLITGHFEDAIKIGLGEVFTKTLLYFLHERVWNRISESNNRFISHGRSLLKGISWRVFGTIDTFMVAFILTGRPSAASQIATFEVITKLALYYFHERVWERVVWGKIDRTPHSTTVEECMNCQ